MRPLLSLLAVMALCLALPAHAAGKWTRLRSAHFEFVGDAGEGDIRRTAQHLEQFREVLSRALPPGAVTSSVPTIVIVFKNDGSLTPYKPRFQGRPVDLAGFFQGGAAVNYIVVNAAARDSGLKTIYHEYAHFLTGNTAGRVPVWVNEGLAGFYETFEERDGGKSALIGVPRRDYLLLLQNSTLMPLVELLAVGHDSPTYNEGDRRTVFYAESWALVHYLTLGNPKRAGQLQAYLTNLKGDASPDAAFRDAFGVDVDTLERELREYVRRISFLQVRLVFDEKVNIIAVPARGEAIDDIEAAAYLGDLLARMRRPDEARAHLQRLLDRNANSGRAVTALGLLELEAGNVNEARLLLERAVALAPDDGAVQSALGRALLASAQDQETDEARDAVLQRARAVLSRAVELAPESADTTALLGRVEGLAGDPARALSLLEGAVRMAPANESYRVALAEALVWQNQYERAITELGPLMASGTTLETREIARELMVEIARLSTAVLVADDRPRSITPSSPASTDAPLSRNTAVSGDLVLDLRLVGDGETRVLGALTSLECRPRSVVLHVDLRGRSLQLEAGRLDDVEFITYTSATSGAVSCGAVQPPARVLVTYRAKSTTTPEGSTDGQAVAIEVLPEGYTPR